MKPELREWGDTVSRGLRSWQGFTWHAKELDLVGRSVELYYNVCCGHEWRRVHMLVKIHPPWTGSMGYKMPGFGGPGERLHRTEGVDSFWVWGKLAAVIEPKSPSSRPGKPSHASLWEAKALSSLLGTQATLSTQGWPCWPQPVETDWSMCWTWRRTTTWSRPWMTTPPPSRPSSLQVSPFLLPAPH